MADSPYVGCNFTIPSNECTLETCCRAQGVFTFIPSWGGNLFYIIFFGVFIVPQIGLGIFYKTWGLMVAMIIGLVLEVLGYVAKLQLHNNLFSSDSFLLYLITITIGPVFISAAIYLCLTRIIMLYGQHLSRFAPKTIAITFMTSDFCSLVLQAAGGAIADTADTDSLSQSGIDIMIAGLFLQAISLAVFLLVVGDFALRCKRGVLNMDHERQRVRNRPVFKVFLVSIVLATVFILIRSAYRVAELWEGFRGDIWNNETEFFVLDGAMIALATICLTAFHPGPAFAGQWNVANWSFRKSKAGSKSGEHLPIKEENQRMEQPTPLTGYYNASHRLN